MPAPPPLITETGRPFWDGLREERVMLQRCGACRRRIFYPRIACPHCGVPEPKWEEAANLQATLYSFTCADAPVSFDFADAGPLLLAIVAFSDDIRLASTLVDIAPPEIHIGMALAPCFDHSSFDPITVLRFRPAV